MNTPREYRIDHWGWAHWTARPGTGLGSPWFIWAPTRWILLWRLPRAIKRNEALKAATEIIEMPS